MNNENTDRPRYGEARILANGRAELWHGSHWRPLADADTACLEAGMRLLGVHPSTPAPVEVTRG